MLVVVEPGRQVGGSRLAGVEVAMVREEEKEREVGLLRDSPNKQGQAGVCGAGEQIWLVREEEELKGKLESREEEVSREEEASREEEVPKEEEVPREEEVSVDSE